MNKKSRKDLKRARRETLEEIDQINEVIERLNNIVLLLEDTKDYKKEYISYIQSILEDSNNNDIDIAKLERNLDRCYSDYLIQMDILYSHSDINF